MDALIDGPITPARSAPADAPLPVPGLRTITAVRARARDLATLASLGAGRATLAGVARAAWDELGRAVADPAERLALRAELVLGVCASARWLEAARCRQIVPPLGALVRTTVQGGRAGLCVDLVLPADARRADAQSWAHDIATLLGAMPCDVSMCRVDDGTPAPHRTAAGPVLRVWGCMSLVHVASPARAGGFDVRRIASWLQRRLA